VFRGPLITHTESLIYTRVLERMKTVIFDRFFGQRVAGHGGIGWGGCIARMNNQNHWAHTGAEGHVVGAGRRVKIGSKYRERTLKRLQMAWADEGVMIHGEYERATVTLIRKNRREVIPSIR